MCADVVDGENVRMVERTRGAGFLLKTVQPVFILGVGRRQHLDSDISSQPRITRALDFAHPAGANGRDNFIWSKSGACDKSHKYFSDTQVVLTQFRVQTLVCVTKPQPKG